MKAQISFCKSNCDKKDIRIIIRLAMGRTMTAVMSPKKFALALMGLSDVNINLETRNVTLSSSNECQRISNALEVLGRDQNPISQDWGQSKTDNCEYCAAWVGVALTNHDEYVCRECFEASQLETLKSIIAAAQEALK